MAITRLNSLAIPAGTVEPADISYPLTNFSSTGIDDNADALAITIDSSENVGIGTASPAAKLDVAGQIVSNDSFKLTANVNTPSGNSLFRPASNTLAFGTNSNERMRINSSGDFGVGNSNPLARLHVTQTEVSVGETDPLVRFERFTSGDNHYLDIGVDNSNNLVSFKSTGSNDGGFTFEGSSAEHMRITSSGYVGIGETSPATMLEVNGNWVSAQGQLTINAPSGQQYTGLTLQNNGTAIGYLYADHTGNNTILYSTASRGIQFYTNNSVSATITSAGNMGIGTTNPAYKLSIHEDAAGTTYPIKIENSNTTSGNGVALLFTHRAHTGDNQGSIEYVGAGTNNTNSMIFKTEASGVNGMTEKMRIDSTGNVGIGATSPAGPLHIQSATNRTLILDGTFATGSYTWQSVRRSGTEKWRWFLESDDDISLYGDVNSVGQLMRWSSDGQVYINRSSSISAGTASKLCITGNIDIDGNPGSTNVIRLYQSATEEGQIYGHTTGLRFYNFSGDVTSIKAAADATLQLIPGTGTTDPVLQFCNQAGGITTEGFEIWYNNDVGDVHLNTTYNNAAANISFHTKVAASKSTSNERFRINGDGGVQIFNTVAGDYILNADTTSFGGRMAAFPGRFIIGPNGNSYPEIGYNFNQTTAGTSNTKIAGDTSYKINFGTSGKFTFSSSGSASAGSTITWTDVMTITNGAFVGIGSNATSPVSPLTVHAQTNNYGPITARTGNYATMWSILPWSTGNTYISSGIYYANNAWVHASASTSNCLFDINPNSGIRWYCSNNSSGSWNVASNVQLFNTSGQLTASSASDSRLKENVADYSIATALQKVNALRPVSFEWNETIKAKKGTEYQEGTHVGFIAQEVETIYPEACLIADTDAYDEDAPFDMDPNATYYGDIRGVRAEKMVPILVGAIKELTRRLELLEG